MEANALTYRSRLTNCNKSNKLAYSHNHACSAEQGWLEGIGRGDLQLDKSTGVGKGALHCDHWHSTGHAHL